MAVRTKEAYLNIGTSLEPNSFGAYGAGAILNACAQDTSVAYIKFLDVRDKKGNAFEVTVINDSGVERTGTGTSRVEATADACSKF